MYRGGKTGARRRQCSSRNSHLEDGATWQASCSPSVQAEWKNSPGEIAAAKKVLRFRKRDVSGALLKSSVLRIFLNSYPSRILLLPKA